MVKTDDLRPTFTKSLKNSSSLISKIPNLDTKSGIDESKMSNKDREMNEMVLENEENQAMKSTEGTQKRVRPLDRLCRPRQVCMYVRLSICIYVYECG